MNKTPMTKQKWKTLFLLLAALNVLTAAAIIILINLPSADGPVPTRESLQEGDVRFQVHTNRDDINKLITQYLKKEGLTGPIEYEVFLTDVVELYGTLPVFGREVELKLTFEPIAQKNGDIVLKQKTISVGQMNLPVSYVMSFINKQYKTPEWVTIQPNEKQIYVSLRDMKLKSDIRIKANKFDLKNDDISFTLTVPSL